jgi:hypothetical protein
MCQSVSTIGRHRDIPDHRTKLGECSSSIIVLSADTYAQVVTTISQFPTITMKGTSYATKAPTTARPVQTSVGISLLLDRPKLIRLTRRWRHTRTLEPSNGRIAKYRRLQHHPPCRVHLSNRQSDQPRQDPAHKRRLHHPTSSHRGLSPCLQRQHRIHNTSTLKGHPPGPFPQMPTSGNQRSRRPLPTHLSESVTNGKLLR